MCFFDINIVHNNYSDFFLKMLQAIQVLRFHLLELEKVKITTINALFSFLYIFSITFSLIEE